MTANRIRSWVLGGVVLLTGVLLGAGVLWKGLPGPLPPGPPSPGPLDGPGEDGPFFRDVTAGSGLDFTYRNGEEAGHYAILESLGGGVALLDYDGDGLLDIFVTGGGYFDGPDKKQIKGYPCRLYKNLGDWKFRDVTAEVGLDLIDFYTHGCAVADYDRDGWPDLLVTGYGRLALFHNVPGSKGRRFLDVTREAGLRGGHLWATSAAWGDLDGDGYPDLYVCQYVDWSFANHPTCEGYQPAVERDVCPPRQFEALPHLLFRNNGNGSFRAAGLKAGLHAPRKDADYDRLTHLGPKARERLRESDRERDFGKGLGVVLVDVNGDGRPDIYVANDTTDKFLYLNRGGPGDFRFEDVALDAGVAHDDYGAPNGSMGVDAGDYDHSGRPSLLVTNYQNEVPALYRHLGGTDPPLFQFSSRTAGIAGIGRKYVGFGTGFFDFDNDGWEDVVMVNGHVIRHPSGTGVRQRPVLLRNEGNRDGGPHFVNVSPAGGPYFQAEHQGRGLAIGDLDNDGRPDLIVSHVNGPVTLLRNEAGRGRHWLGVELADPGHRDLVGTRLTLDVNGALRTRFARGGGSYLSSGDRRHLFGLGAADRVGRLTVTWPSGREQTWDGLAVDRYWRVLAGEPEARDLSPLRGGRPAVP